MTARSKADARCMGTRHIEHRNATRRAWGCEILLTPHHQLTPCRWTGPRFATAGRLPVAVDEQFGEYGASDGLLPVASSHHEVPFPAVGERLSTIKPSTPIAAPISDTASNAGEVVPVRASPRTTIATEPGTIPTVPAK
jgi:hypothetical protein